MRNNFVNNSICKSNGWGIIKILNNANTRGTNVRKKNLKLQVVTDEIVRQSHFIVNGFLSIVITTDNNMKSKYGWTLIINIMF